MAFPRLYPLIKSITEPAALDNGPWVDDRPMGVTVHDTADRDLDRVIQGGIDRKLGYHLIIDRDGGVHQTAWMDRRVDHAGDADWNSLSPNRHHIAVAVLAWGRVSYTPSGLMVWAKGQPLLPTTECAMRKGNLGQGVFWWDACTAAQEDALMSVLRWMVASGIPSQNVCGHDECALPKGRKEDPGGTLSLSMQDIRKSLASIAGNA